MAMKKFEAGPANATHIISFFGFLKFEKFEYNYGLTGILGLFCLSIISSYTHLFYPHNYTHNVIIIFLGLLGLILFNKKFLSSDDDIINISLLFLLIYL